MGIEIKSSPGGPLSANRLAREADSEIKGKGVGAGEASGINGGRGGVAGEEIADNTGASPPPAVHALSAAASATA